MSTKPAPRQFVRYRNRKLHEVGNGNPYTTMEALLEIAAAGVPVVVTDDVTGKDITAFTLTRLAYDRSRMDPRAYKVADVYRLLMTSPPPSSRAA